MRRVGLAQCQRHWRSSNRFEGLPYTHHMSRPPSPTYVVPTFASDATYPAGANVWSSQPVKVSFGSPSGGFVPGQPAAAQYFNYLWNSAFSVDASAQAAIVNLQNYLGQSTALNFGIPVATPTTLAGAVFDPKNRAWFFTGTAGKLYSSFNNGYTFGSNLIGAVAAGTEALRFIDADGAGAVIAACDSASIFKLSGGTWAKVATGGTYASGVPSVVYDPIHATWCWSGVDAGANNWTQIYTSTAASGGAVWTNRTAALAAVAYNPSRLAVNKVTGRICLIGHSGTTGKVWTSDDGGATWTARANFTMTVTSPTEVEVFYNPASGKWMHIMGKTGTCEVWTSSDNAVTWTKAATLTTVQILRAAPDGFMWCAVSAVGDILYSLDDGATWLFTGYQAGSAARGMFSGNGGFMCVSTASVASSFVASGGGALAT